MIIASINTAGTQAVAAAPSPAAPAPSTAVVADFLSMIGVLLGAGDQQAINIKSRKEEKDQKETPDHDPPPYLGPQTIPQPPAALLFHPLEFSLGPNQEGEAAPPAGSGDFLPPSAALKPENLQRPAPAVPDLAFRLKIFGIEPQPAALPVAGPALAPAALQTPSLNAAASPVLPPPSISPPAAASNPVRPNDAREPAAPASAPEPQPAPGELAPPGAANLRGQSSGSDARHSRSAAQDESPGESRPPEADSATAPRFDLRGPETEALASSASPRRHAVMQSEASPIRPLDIPPVPHSRAEPLRELSMRLPDANQGKVDVHILNQGGRIQVDVRATNADLAQSLRSNVDDLVSQLHDRGYRAETSPLNGISGAAALDASGQQLHQNPKGHGDADRGGGSYPRNPQQQQDQQRRRQPPAWFQYFDETDSQLAGRAS